MKLVLGSLVIAEITERFNYENPAKSLGWEVEIWEDYNRPLTFLWVGYFDSYEKAKEKVLTILPQGIEKFISEIE